MTPEGLLAVVAMLAAVTLFLVAASVMARADLKELAGRVERLEHEKDREAPELWPVAKLPGMYVTAPSLQGDDLAGRMQRLEERMKEHRDWH